MIHEEICTYEVCKLAKEKGFPQQYDSLTHIYGGKDSFNVGIDLKYKKCEGTLFNISEWSPCLNDVADPTQSLLQRWLRDNHKADVWVETAATMATKNQRCYYWHIAYDSDGSCIYVLDSMLSHSTYEKALEEGLKEAIIEFVEEKR